MRRVMTLSLMLAAAAVARAEPTPLVLPSGRVVGFHDVVHGASGPAGLTLRFRFLEADLAQVVDTTPYAELEADMHHLCETYALDRISNIGPQPAQLIISISDRPVEFGANDPGVTQVFEAYRIEDGACIWEGF